VGRDHKTGLHPSVLGRVCECFGFKVTHDKLKEGSKMLRGVSRGWPLVLYSMKSYLETGRAIDIWCLEKEVADPGPVTVFRQSPPKSQLRLWAQ
jgi:hypothetical protein